MSAFWEGLFTIVGLIIGVAALSVILSPKATTAAVGQTFFSGIANDIGVAQSPVTGNPFTINTDYPSQTGANIGS